MTKQALLNGAAPTQMRILQLLILIVLTACENQETSKTLPVSKSPDTLSNGLRIINRNNDSPYYYKDLVETDSLIGNYQVVYAQNDSSYFLYLKHFDSLYLLNKTANYTSLYSLGIVSEDDSAYFILGHDNGNSEPYSYEYVDKQSGKNPLGFGTEFLDYTLLNKIAYLLYADTIINGKTRLTLFNTNNNRKEYYYLQNDFSELYIDTLTTEQLAIKYTEDRNSDNPRTKIYNR